jgi:hypothetical protein
VGEMPTLNPGSGPITAEWTVDETIRRFPTTGPIFLQGGRLYVAQRGQLYATYPPLTLAEYATHNALAIEQLLELLNAAAKAEEFAQRTGSSSRSEGDESGRRALTTAPIGSIGYTGSYRERSEDVVDVSVVAVLEARGPE